MDNTISRYPGPTLHRAPNTKITDEKLFTLELVGRSYLKKKITIKKNGW
jgi:hypothetical protein